MNSALAICDFAAGQWLVIGPNVGPLQYYSHLPTIVLSLVLAFFILFQNWRGLSNKILFVTIMTYVAWVFFDSVIWATNRSDVIMFMWSLQVLIEPVVYIGGLYLLYSLTDKKDISFATKIIWFALYLPLIVLSPTKYILPSFDLTYCLSNEAYMSYYSYFIEFIMVCWLIVYAIYRYRTLKTREEKKEILWLSTGIFLLLVSFSYGNIVGSITGDWQLAQYGLFGMPVFAGFLVYSIVRYHTFRSKLVGAVALVLGLWTLTFALLFVNNPTVFRGVSMGTFVVALGFGIQLIRSVNREVRQREQIEQQEKALEEINAQQESLLHFITHEVKGYLTKSKAMFAAIVENDFPGTPDNLKVMASQALADTQKGVETVRDILDSSNLKRGSTEYNKSSFDFKVSLEESVKEFEKAAAAKNLTLKLEIESGTYIVSGDEAKIRRHVVRNLIDNAIKYTPQGSINIHLSQSGNNVICRVKDSGVGINANDMKKLFTQGGKGVNSTRINVDSTGYGLFIAKVVVEAHKGTISVASDGEGKGSTFTVTLPL